MHTTVLSKILLMQRTDFSKSWYCTYESIFKKGEPFLKILYMPERAPYSTVLVWCKYSVRTVLVQCLYGARKVRLGICREFCVGIQTAALLVTLWISYRRPVRIKRAGSLFEFHLSITLAMIWISRTVVGSKNWMLSKESLRVSSHSILITLVKSNN